MLTNQLQTLQEANDELTKKVFGLNQPHEDDDEEVPNQMEDANEEAACSNELLQAFQQMQGMSGLPTQTSENKMEIVADDAQDTYIEGLTSNEIDKLKEWSSKSSLHLLYDNKKTTFTREKCLEVLKNKSDVFIILEDTNGNMFGSYHHIIPNELGVWANDQQHFIFSLRNRTKAMSKFDVVNESKYSLMVADFVDDDDELKSTIIEVGNFYSISMEEICQMSSNVAWSYKDAPSLKDCYFTFNSTVELKRIIFVN